MSVWADFEDETLDEAGPDDWADAESIIQRIRDAEQADAEHYREDHPDDET